MSAPFARLPQPERSVSAEGFATRFVCVAVSSIDQAFLTMLASSTWSSMPLVADSTVIWRAVCPLLAIGSRRLTTCHSSLAVTVFVTSSDVPPVAVSLTVTDAVVSSAERTQTEPE